MTLAQIVRDAIRTAIEERGWSQDKVAHKMGLTVQAVNYMLNGRRGISLERVEQFADILDIPPAILCGAERPEAHIVQFVGSDEAMPPNAAAYELAPIPRLDSDRIAAGPPRIIHTEEVEEYVFVPRGTLHAQPELYICMTVAGDSMEPTIPSGAHVGINRSVRTPWALNRRIVALSTEEGAERGATIKRLYWREPYVLGIPDNPAAESEEFDVREFNPVVGRVDWVWFEL